MLSYETEIMERMRAALNSFAWDEVTRICSELTAALCAKTIDLSRDQQRALLYELRRKCRYEDMVVVAETLIWTEQANEVVYRSYAQALIDRGRLKPAELMLEKVLNRGEPLRPVDRREITGSLGRVYKQAWIDHGPGVTAVAQVYVDRALDAYLKAYAPADIENTFWHGINSVAILKKAARDGMSIAGRPNADALTEDILEALVRLEAEKEEQDCWALATQVEALVALDRFEEAEAKALDYLVCPGADVFQIQSTRRQLEELWALSPVKGPGRHIMSLLNAALLRRAGGSVSLTANERTFERRNIEETETRLEAIFGANATKPLHWYLTGLKRCESIARLELRDGQGVGTGWLVNPADFGLQAHGQVLVSNAHVVCHPGPDRGYPPSELVANFQQLDLRVDLGEIVWESPYGELDTTFVTLREEVRAEMIPLNPEPLALGEPAPRVYIIGYPGGRGLEFSIHDNNIIDLTEQKLHYRTATEMGSSGSPVFDQTGWRAVALHHAGSDRMPRLHGTGVYAANEGILALEIRRAIAESRFSYSN